MRILNETVTADCRYGDIACSVWGDWEVIWEQSEADYDGFSRFLITKGGKFVFYEYWYGSCSGCDEWEAQGYSDAKVAEIMQHESASFDSLDQIRAFVESIRRDAHDRSGLHDDFEKFLKLPPAQGETKPNQGGTK